MICSLAAIAKPLLAINALTLAYVTASVVMKSVQSDSNHARRSKGLEVVAQHVMSDSCWTTQEATPFKIGDRLDAGEGNGHLPTSCVYAPKTGQYLQAAYLDNQLQVVNIYSPKEVNSQISLLKKRSKSR